MKLSEFVYSGIRNALRGSIEDNNIYIKTDVRAKIDLDTHLCYKMLNTMGIVPKFVTRYLKMKYKPTWINDNIAIFKDVSCIQKSIFKDGKLRIEFMNSEPHKLPTDINFVLGLYQAKGMIVDETDISISIQNLKLVPQDILLYRAFLPDTPPSYEIRQYADDLVEKYPNLYVIGRIKKRSIKRKFLRYYVVRKVISWQQLRIVMNITDFSEEAIKKTIDSLNIQE